MNLARIVEPSNWFEIMFQLIKTELYLGIMRGAGKEL